MDNNDREVAEALRGLYDRGFIELEVNDNASPRVWPTATAREAIAENPALHLVGRRVVWAHDAARRTSLFPEPVQTMRVEAATTDGRVLIEGFCGEFAPHLFRVVEG